MEKPPQCYCLAFLGCVADHRWMVHQLQLVQKPTRHLKSPSRRWKGFGLPSFVHNVGGGSSLLLARVSWMLSELAVVDGMVACRVLLLLSWTWGESVWIRLWWRVVVSAGPVCRCPPPPFPGAKSVLMCSCFLLSCWHLFLAEALLYLHPLIVITACKEARIGETNKWSGKKKKQPRMFLGKVQAGVWKYVERRAQIFLGLEEQNDGGKDSGACCSSVRTFCDVVVAARPEGSSWSRGLSPFERRVCCWLARGRGERSAKRSRGASLPSTTAVAPAFFPLVFS